jgi:hypothetical protein
MAQMTKKLVILFPYIFTKFDFYKYEIDKLHKSKDFDLEVHELSEILNKKKFNEAWKVKKKIFKNHIKFDNLYQWTKYILRHDQKIIIYSFVSLTNLSSFLIHFVIWKTKCNFMIRSSVDVATYKDKSNFLKQILVKKPNLNQILFHSMRVLVIFLTNFLKFQNIINLYIYKKNKTFKSKNNLDIKIVSDDVSKCLIDKNIKTKKQNTVAYLDTPSPYYDDDYMESGKTKKIRKENISKYYNQLKRLFLILKKKYKLKILIIPHPKNKGKINPYFKNYLHDHSINAAQKNIKKSKLVISQGSTAIAHAIYYKKPVILIYSNILNDFRLLYDLKAQSKVTDAKIINLSNNLNLQTNNIFLINKKKYNYYKSHYMINNFKKVLKPNYLIIKDLIKNL